MTKTLDLVWGAKGIGEAINRSPRQVHHLLETGQITAVKKVGAQWCASVAGLAQQFSQSGNAKPDNKAAENAA